MRLLWEIVGEFYPRPDPAQFHKPDEGPAVGLRGGQRGPPARKSGDAAPLVTSTTPR